MRKIALSIFIALLLCTSAYAGNVVTFFAKAPADDTTAPSTTISTTDPSAISSDALTIAGTASDAVGVSGCKWRIGSAPDAGNGTACTGTTSFSCSTSGYSEGANTAYVGCYDAAGNYGSDSITVNYTPAACADSSCSGFLVCQNFEGAGYDNSESWTEEIGTTGGVVNEDYTTSPGRGSQSLQVRPGSTTPSYTYMTFTPQAAIYGHFKMYVATAPSVNYADVFSTSDAGITQLVAILIDTDRGIRLASPGAINSDKTAPLDLNTWYHVWYYIAKGTGANAQAWLRYSTSNVMPASNSATITTGTWNTDRAAAYPSSLNASGSDIRFDQFLVKTTAIGDVCE